jgi:hypothetical protein
VPPAGAADPRCILAEHGADETLAEFVIATIGDDERAAAILGKTADDGPDAMAAFLGEFRRALPGRDAPDVIDLAAYTDPAAGQPTAQALTAEWLDRCARRPPRDVIGRVGKQLSRLLGDGIDPADIRAGLAAWQAKGLDPSVLPSVVNEVMNGGRGGNGIPRRWAENRAKYARWIERARTLDDDERRELEP